MEAPPPQEIEELAPPRDLRAELFQDLSTQFTATLESNGSLPVAAKVALVELLDLEAPTAAQIVAAVSKNDTEQEKAGHE